MIKHRSTPHKFKIKEFLNQPYTHYLNVKTKQNKNNLIKVCDENIIVKRITVWVNIIGNNIISTSARLFVFNASLTFVNLYNLYKRSNIDNNVAHRNEKMIFEDCNRANTQYREFVF